MSITMKNIYEQTQSLTVIGVVALSLAACSSMGLETAQQAVVAPDYATQFIHKADWSEAEQALRAGDMDDPLLQLNLAYVLRKMDREDEAAAIYAAIIEGTANPYATMVGGHPRRVKSVARDAIVAMNLPEAR